MASKEVLKELEAYRRLCTHLDYDNDDYMLNGEYEGDNEVIETALKEHELMKQTKAITVDKDISNDDLEKFVHQRMFVDNSKKCEIKPLFDEEVISQKEAYEKWHKILDFEEELGIDLSILFSALKNGVYYFDYENQLIHDYVSLINNYITAGAYEKLSCSFETFYDRQILSFEDYGKTWSLYKKDLTKKELENEEKI